MSVFVQFVSGKVLTFQKPISFTDLSSRILELYYSENEISITSKNLFDKVLFFDKDHNQIQYDNQQSAKEDHYYIFIETGDNYDNLDLGIYFDV